MENTAATAAGRAGLCPSSQPHPLAWAGVVGAGAGPGGAALDDAAGWPDATGSSATRWRSRGARPWQALDL